ncbi:LamG-like jellyroll fold domain-containing protein [Kitasatospora sp. NPDC057692]|uniref:LamG-like jellyroll fold domain-containing protein n=1 Tax=Kitasatospora sp. NPDC057692 TaxID=3346215 RepID=UPI0036B2B279
MAPAAFADTAPGVPPTWPGAAPSASSGPSSETMAAADAERAQAKPIVTATQKAIARAKETKNPVPVPELTDEFSETVVTPEGHLSRTQHAVQQRTRKPDGGWAVLDGRLVADPAGGFRPAVAASGVHLSGGGEGPLGTLTGADGESLAIGSPFPLTKPVLDAEGGSLTYPEVEPGVDLKVTVTKYGALSTVLVVKTAEAAKNPKLKKVRFGTEAKGVTVKADADNNLTATAADGTVRWHAPAPQVWDSSPATPAAAAGGAARGVQGAPGGNNAADGPGTAEKSSSAFGPGAGAKVAVMPAAVTADAVELTVDQAVLGQGQGPWYIDPSWIPDARSANAWTWTQQAYPNFPNYMRNTGNGDEYSHPGVGYQGWRTEKGIERAYYQFDTSGFGSTVINKATLSVWQYQSSDWSCTNAYTVDLYLTGGINGGTTWANPPGVIGGRIGEASVAGSGQSGCGGTRQFNYDVTSAYRAHTPGNNALAFGLFARNESDRNAFKRMDYQPVVAVEYDITPDTPTGQYAWPAPSTAVPWAEDQGCNGSSIGWMNSSSGFNGAVSLNATVHSPVQNQLQSWSHIWDYSLPGVPDVDSGLSGWVGNGANASFNVRSDVIKDGHVYGWSTHATDGLVGMSNSTPTCRFGVDLTPPTIQVPNGYTQLSEAQLATQYPPSGNGQTTRKRTGEVGIVPFTVADPAPDGGGSSGLACARWSWDPQLAGAGWVCGSSIPQGGADVVPNRWGTNILYIQVMDNARNVSLIAPYSFYVPWNPDGPPPAFGDVTGDSAPDIVTPDQSGNLRAYTVPGNPLARNTAVTLVAGRADSPTGQGWDNVQFAHRGTLTGGNNIDDFIAHAPGSPNLYVYGNPGNTGQYGRIDTKVELAKPQCVVTATENCAWRTAAGYNAADWSNTLRVASLGDPVNADLNYKLQFKNKTGLLTVESTNGGTDGALWYYPATVNNTLGKPVLLAASGWKDKELITPGDWAKQGHPGLWARNLQAAPDGAKGALLAYTFTTGTVVATDKQGQPVIDGAGTVLNVPTVTGISHVSVIGSVPVEGWPVLGSDGDLTGKGSPTLWGRTNEGRIDIWWGETVNPGAADPGFTWYVGPEAVADTSVNPLWWGLDGQSQTSDSTLVNPLIAYQTVGTTTDHNGAANRAAAFNGAGYYRTTHSAGTTTGLDTTQSFSVSAWVRLGSAAGFQSAVSIVGQERSPFYLHYHPGLQQWLFTVTGEDLESTGAYYSAASGETAQVGVWTHLTGVYNSGTHTVTLYVNGRAVGSNKAPTSWKTNGGLLIGAEGTNKTGVSTNALFSGAISDVRVHPYALTDQQANTVATVGSNVQIRSAYNAGSCIDNWGGQEGAVPRIYDCYNGSAQYFTLTADNRIKVPGTERCLSTSPTGSPVVILPCGNADQQTWVRQSDGRLYNPASQSCLELPGWQDANGTALGLWPCNSGANQRWHLQARAA